MAISDSISAALSSFLQGVFTDEATAAAYASDPAGALAAAGLSEADVSHEEMQEAVAHAAQEAGLPAETAQALSEAPAPAPGQPPLQTLVSEVNHATATVYGGDSVITQDLTAIDNAQDINIDVGEYGDLDGDVEIDTTNVNATGDRAVAAGDDIDNVATGDAAVVVDGDNEGGIASGDGAVAAGDDINAPVNTGVNTGIISDGDVENAVVGDGNQAANVDGDAENSVFNFGDGDVTNFGDADIDDSAISIGGNATNVSDNYADDGSAIGAGNAAGANVDTDIDIDDSFNQDTDVDAYESVVNTEQGEGEQDSNVDESLNDDFDEIH